MRLHLFNHFCESRRAQRQGSGDAWRASYVRVGHFAVVGRTVEREAAVAPLDVVAGLAQGAVVGSCGALVDV